VSKQNHLHIVSFDIPFPANYGGVIDVFYKLKYLSENQVLIHLHCFEYGRQHSKELEQICESVNYYPRRNNLRAQFSAWPYIVNSRLSNRLVKNLQKDDFPILFEGMHTLGVGLDIRLEKRKKIYRESNIEHHYYNHLSLVEKNLFKKSFYKIESQKLKWFEKNIAYFDNTLVVSEADKDYLNDKYPLLDVVYLPSFHANAKVDILEGLGSYALYNGNLSVAENIEAVQYLIAEVFSKIDYPFIIAGLNPTNDLIDSVKLYPNISIKKNLHDNEMKSLVQHAQFNILTTAQATGLKLKLLNTLYQGRFCIVNDKMLRGTHLDEYCIVANSSTLIIEKIKKLQKTPFTQSDISIREAGLSNLYDNRQNIKKLMRTCFE